MPGEVGEVGEVGAVGQSGLAGEVSEVGEVPGGVSEVGAKKKGVTVHVRRQVLFKDNIIAIEPYCTEDAFCNTNIFFCFITFPQYLLLSEMLDVPRTDSNGYCTIKSKDADQKRKE